MQDRLPDLRQAILAKNSSLADCIQRRASAVYEARRHDRTDMGVFEAQLGTSQQDEGRDSPFMAEYLTQINSIKEAISGFSATCCHTRSLIQKMRATANPTEKNRYLSEIRQTGISSSQASIQLKTSLEALKHANVAFRAKHPNSSETRIRENMHSVLTRQFGNMLKEFQALQTTVKKVTKEGLERQVRIVCPEASDWEVKEMVEDGDSSVCQKQIFAKMTGAHENLQNAYEDIQEKHRDVKRLEQCVAELHQMFVDLATLVDQQGELLDQVEYAVQNAADYTEKADRDLVVAQKNMSKRKKWACFMSVCLVIVALIVAIPVAITFKG